MEVGSNDQINVEFKWCIYYEDDTLVKTRADKEEDVLPKQMSITSRNATKESAELVLEEEFSKYIASMEQPDGDDALVLFLEGKEKNIVYQDEDVWVAIKEFFLFLCEWDEPPEVKEPETYTQEELEEHQKSVPELWDADPDCWHELDPNSWSGIKCMKCTGWYRL